jgi:outer membrane biosynthesis protein TonB
VRTNFGEFRRCYEEYLRPCPNLQGRVTVRFVIGRRGQVLRAADAGSDVPDSRTIACVVRAMKALAFPAPKSGPVTVQYPFLFSPGG